MKYNDLKFATNVIPIFNEDGVKIDEVYLQEKIIPVPRRRCAISESGVFYKGAGIIYMGHYVNNCDKKVKLVSKTNIKYEKFNVVYPNLYGKYGIFTFPHQPIFSDFEGACGKKERKILEMQKKFKYSAIELIDVIDIPIKNHSIYKYKLKELSGNYKDTLNLIEYLLQENYNTAWDKNVWDDVVSFGYIRDLADWFISKSFSHKLGTIFAFLSSLSKKDKYLYEIIVRELTGLEQLSEHHIIYIAALIVKKYSPQCVIGINLDCVDEKLYTKLWEELYSGKACCHLEDDRKWDFIRGDLKNNISKNVSIAMKDLMFYRIALHKK